MKDYSHLDKYLGNLNEATNAQVINSFLNKKYKDGSGAGNLKHFKHSNGWSLTNYSTPLLFVDDKGNIYFNTEKFSVSTTKIQNNIRQMLAGEKFKEVDTKKIEAMIK